MRMVTTADNAFSFWLALSDFLFEWGESVRRASRCDGKSVWKFIIYEKVKAITP